MRLRKHYIYLCAAVLFWGNRSARIHNGKKATKLAQNRCITNSKEGTRRKMDTLPFIAWFVSLVSLMLSWKITNVRRKPASDTAPISQWERRKPASDTAPLSQWEFEWVNCPTFSHGKFQITDGGSFLTCKDFGECLISHSPPVLLFFFFFF